MDYRSNELVDGSPRGRDRGLLKLALRGAVVVVAGTVLALLLSASGLESFRFSAPAIITFRIVTVVVFVALLVYGLGWPPRRRRTGRDVSRGMRSDARGGDHQRRRSDCERWIRRALAEAGRETRRAG